ncbi:hypothetical protein ACKKBG_A39015 [Auxenochlorella protothecoides x Auxenochlorella symbiontica]
MRTTRRAPGIAACQTQQQDWGAIVGDTLADVGKFLAEFRQASREIDARKKSGAAAGRSTGGQPPSAPVTSVVARRARSPAPPSAIATDPQQLYNSSPRPALAHVLRTAVADARAIVRSLKGQP